MIDADPDPDRVEVDHREEDSSSGRRCHSKTTSATASVILEMVPELSSTLSVEARWCWISLTVIPPAYRLMIIALSPSRRCWPLHTKRGVKVPARSRGTTGLKGTHPRVHHLRRGSVPGIAARLAGRLALVVAQVLGRVSGQAPLQDLLDQHRQQAISPGHVHLPGINLLKQAIQSPGLAQLIDHISPTSSSPVVIIGSSHQCQSFHKGLHKPLNRLRQRLICHARSTLPNCETPTKGSTR